MFLLLCLCLNKHLRVVHVSCLELLYAAMNAENDHRKIQKGK